MCNSVNDKLDQLTCCSMLDQFVAVPFMTYAILHIFLM